jgi:hypothetical protein
MAHPRPQDLIVIVNSPIRFIAAARSSFNGSRSRSRNARQFPIARVRANAPAGRLAAIAHDRVVPALDPADGSHAGLSTSNLRGDFGCRPADFDLRCGRECSRCRVALASRGQTLNRVLCFA